MLTHMHFAVLVGWLVIAMLALLWILSCAMVANKMEQQGFSFSKAFISCCLFTPLAGILAVTLERLLRPRTDFRTRYLAK
jgi:hypothetical protein